jgi:membrane fusion protein (multidrug efflux system)
MKLMKNIHVAPRPAFSRLAGTILCLSLTLLSCSKEQAAPPVATVAVKAAKVVRGTVPVIKEFVGQTKGAVDAEIRARVEGVVLGVHFEEGKNVTTGQLLYTIDPAPYDAKVAQAKGTLAEAETRLAKAESDLKRVRPLVKMKALSERDLDTAVAQEGAARGVVDAAKASLDSALIELSYCKILAPIDGIIGLSKAKVGEFVGRPPNPVVLNTVSQLDPIHVRFSITEQEYLYFSRLKQKELESGTDKKRVLELVLADGSVHSEKGAISSVNREIDPTTGSLALEAAFPNTHKLIRPGQYGKVRSEVETINDALLIPKRAIREQQGQFQVFAIKEDKTVETRTLTVGAQSGDLQAISSGLKEGELIVVEGFQRLRSGAQVSFEIEPAAATSTSEAK